MSRPDFRAAARGGRPGVWAAEWGRAERSWATRDWGSPDPLPGLSPGPLDTDPGPLDQTGPLATCTERPSTPTMFSPWPPQPRPQRSPRLTSAAAAPSQALVSLPQDGGADGSHVSACRGARRGKRAGTPEAPPLDKWRLRVCTG